MSEPEKNISDNLMETLAELTRLKKDLRNLLKTSPDHLQAHRVYCLYVGKIVEINKAMAQARALDPQTLLIGILKTVTLTLMEKGETAAAETLGQYLEEIGEKVKQLWLDSKGPAWAKDMMKSDLSSLSRSARSEKPPRPRKRDGKNAL